MAVGNWTADFHWLLPDLAVGGHFPPERTADLVDGHGIGAVIDIRAEACDDRKAMAAAGLDFLHLPTLDLGGVSLPMLDEAVSFTRLATEAGRKTLIHCQHGIGRSAITALCVLADRGFQPLEALSLAKDRRALISPSKAQYQAWCQWLERRTGHVIPSYHEFGMIAYRHLAKA